MTGSGKASPGRRRGDRLTARIAIWIIPPLVYVVPFSGLMRLLGRAATRAGTVADPDSDLETARWVDRKLRRMPWPWRRTCLKRAAVLYYLFRRQGRPVSLNIGVKRRGNGKIHAHAWLTSEGVPYLESNLRSLEGLRDIAVFPD